MKSRKLWGGIILICLALVAVVIDKANQFMVVSPFILTVFGLYVVGNIGEWIAKKGK